MTLPLTGIALPNDTDFLWKYMSFEKFVSLLDKRSLFFTRADKFEDPFEGFTPPSVTEHYKDIIGDIAALQKFQKNWSKYTLCSCWHHAPEESMAMWEKYHMHNSGIAIKTTFDDFKNCLLGDDTIFVGNIQYINPYEYSVPENLNEMSMLYTWYFHKRKPFEYEQEFRAINAHYPQTLMDYIDVHGNLSNPETTLENIEFTEDIKTGIHVNVDIDTLISEVITSPYVEDWITDTVKSAVHKYGFDFKVTPSTLLDDPPQYT